MVKAFQQETRSAIPEWEALLVVYGAIFIPVMLALLIGVNLWVWSKSRVNYVFILGMFIYLNYWSLIKLSFTELDSRTKLDYQEYFEVGFVAVFVSVIKLMISHLPELYACRSPHCCFPHFVSHSFCPLLVSAHRTSHQQHGPWFGVASQ